MGERCVFLGQIFVKNAKNDPRTLFNGPNRTKIQNRKNIEFLINSVKSGRFGHSERQNSAVFKDSDLKVCTGILQQVFLNTHIPFFLILTLSGQFGKQNILMTIFPNFFKKNNKIWDNSLIAMFNPHVVLKTNLF